jgi:hypothetical protein
VYYGKAGGSGSRADIQIIVVRAHVGRDSPRADNELLSHLSICEPLCHQTQHFHFSCRQSSRIGYSDGFGGKTCSGISARVVLRSLCRALRPGCREHLFAELGAECSDWVFIHSWNDDAEREAHCSLHEGLQQQPILLRSSRACELGRSHSLIEVAGTRFIVRIAITDCTRSQRIKDHLLNLRVDLIRWLFLR